MIVVDGSRGYVHAPHSGHAPRQGGQLFMLGDHHLEVVMDTGSRVTLRAPR